MIYGASGGLSPLELGLVQSVRRILDSSEGPVMDRQIEMIYLVQRGHGNRMTTLHFDGPPPLFEDTRENLCFAKISYRLGGEKYRTSLFLHRGRLSSLETNKPLSRKALRAVPDSPDASFVFKLQGGLGESLDQEEHVDPL